MPFYRFIMHGTGKLVNGIGGFYTTRWCWAREQESAATKAMNIVRKDIESQRLGVVRSLEVEEGKRISVFDIRRAPNRGYTFYKGDDVDGEERVEEHE